MIDNASEPTLRANPTVTVVIVNWNAGSLLKRCLDALEAQTFKPTQIFLVDNNSSDNSHLIAADFPSVTLLDAGSNLGFAAGNNLAINQSDTDYIALLNPDAVADPSWLEKLIEAAISRPDYGSFGSLQVDDGNQSVADGVGDCYHISGLVWREGFGRSLETLRLEERDIFSPCAAAALYRTDLIKQLGGFDEDYFCYVEDVDLGFRLQLAGYPSRFVPSARVLHVGSATTGGQHSSFSVYHGHRNLVWTFLKNIPMPLLLCLLPVHLVLNLLSVAYLIGRGRGKEILTAKIDALRGLKRCLEKRKAVQQLRKVSNARVWSLMSKRIK